MTLPEIEFEPFPKIARLSRDCVITEKIDGTNGQILITDDGQIHAGSRSRWLDPDSKDDNFGFGRWVAEHKDELIQGLGAGRHYGEFWGSGIQRRYGLTGGDKRFSLFNTRRWSDTRVDRADSKGTFDNQVPDCCSVVPILYEGTFSSALVFARLVELEVTGSKAAPGFMDPEGAIIYHVAAGVFFKKTIKGDDEWKGKS